MPENWIYVESTLDICTLYTPYRPNFIYQVTIFHDWRAQAYTAPKDKHHETDAHDRILP